MKEESGKTQKEFSRRDVLKMAAVAGGGLAIAASGLGVATHFAGAEPKQKMADSKPIPFFGTHQAGIITPQQGHGYLTAFDIDPSIREIEKIMALFISWTQLASILTKGHFQANSSNTQLPPNDTNEAKGLGHSNLTITFGFGRSFFLENGKDRFGLAKSMPKELVTIPKLPHDSIDESISNGDLIVQVCSDNQQVAFHAIRNLIKEALGTANVRWMESGFLNRPKGETPRNLFGFKDGTANVSETDSSGHDRVIWAGKDEPKWMQAGTYLGYRKIQMHIETWDRDSYSDQENVFGRRKDSGAAFGQQHEKDPVNIEKLPKDSHVRIAHSTGQEIFRRAFSYTNGINENTGQLQAGLLFISYQNKPQSSFIKMLQKLGQSDALNEYTTHIASGLYAIPRGAEKNEYIGQSLFEG